MLTTGSSTRATAVAGSFDQRGEDERHQHDNGADDGQHQHPGAGAGLGSHP